MKRSLTIISGAIALAVTGLALSTTAQAHVQPRHKVTCTMHDGYKAAEYDCRTRRNYHGGIFFVPGKGFDGYGGKGGYGGHGKGGYSGPVTSGYK